MSKTPMASKTFSRAYLERPSRSVYRIAEDKCGHPLRRDVCLRTVCAGLMLYRKASYRSDTYMGYPWSTSAAL